MRKIIEGLFFILIPFLTILALLFGIYLTGSPIFFVLTGGSVDSVPQFLRMILPQFSILILLFIFMVFILVKCFRKLRSGENIVNFQKPRQTIFYLFVSLLSLILLVALIFIISWVFSEDKNTPQFFPLDNPKGEYRITKACPGGQGNLPDLDRMKNEINPYGKYDKYCVEYTGTNVFMTNRNEEHFFRVTVGTSKVDLEQFLGKKVQNIKGSWGADKPEREGVGGIAGLNIDSLELAE